MLLGATFWRAVAAGELSEARPYAFQPWRTVGGAGVLRGFRHAAQLALADYLHLALAVSDNDATNVVIAFVGFDRVNALAAELGLGGTTLRRQMMDWESAAAGRDNLTCAGDLTALLELLVGGGPRIGAAAGEHVLASLALQEHRDGLARALPPGRPTPASPATTFPRDGSATTAAWCARPPARPSSWRCSPTARAATRP